MYSPRYFELDNKKRKEGSGIRSSKFFELNPS